jgi:FkbM family methyltransferase
VRPGNEMIRSVHSSLARLARVAPRVRGVGRIGRALSRRWTEHLDVTSVEMRDGARLLLDPRSRTEVGPFWTGDYEVEVLKFLRACLPGEGVALDVGANVGLVAVSLGMHAKKSQGRVIAFEPVPPNFNRLTENIAINGLTEHVQAHQVALGEAAGEVEITMERTDGASTGNAVFTEGLNGDKSYRVKVARLDDLELNLARLDLVKADIEGTEIMFMRGAAATLSRFRPIIFGEFNQYWMTRFGHSSADIAEFVRTNGYRVFTLSGGGAIAPVAELRSGLEELVLVPEGLDRDRARRAGIPET